MHRQFHPRVVQTGNRTHCDNSGEHHRYQGHDQSDPPHATRAKPVDCANGCDGTQRAQQIRLHS